MAIADQNFRPITDPDFNQQYEEYHKVLSLAPENYIRHFMLTGNDAAKLAAAAVMDQKAKAQTAPPAPTQTVIDKLAQPQGLAQLPQGMAPQGPAPAPQQMAQAQGPVAQMADGGIVGLPMDSGMFEGGYAGGGIIAFDDGGDIPSYASQGAVKRPAYLSNPVGKYFNPDELTPYDDTEIKKLLEENPALSMDDIYKTQQAVRGKYGIKDIYEDQRKALEADKAENEKFKESNEADALLNAAAGFLGNTSQFFGPGAEAALKGYTTTKREGQKEYRATAKDLRNLGFEIGRSDQAMRQADMAGDQSLYTSERSRRDGLLKQAQEIKFKNTETKNNALAKGWDASAAYDTNMAVANAKAKTAGKTAGLDVAKLNAQVLDKAEKMMSAQYPPGQFQTYFKANPNEYQKILSGYIQQAEDYIYRSEVPTTAPGATPAAPATAANPSALTKATIAGQKVNPKIQSLLSKYPAGSGSTEDEDE
jgi:hypothetical protein